MGKSARKCLFCEQLAVRAIEDIVPKWLQRHMGIQKRELESGFQKVRRQRTLELDASNPIVQRTVDRKQVFSRLLHGSVCKDCNGKWMSRLENDIKPLLVDLISLNRRIDTMSDDERLLFARWVAKTAFAWNAAYTDSIPVPSGHIKRLSKGEPLAPNTAIVAMQIAHSLENYEHWFSSNWPCHSELPATHDMGQLRAIQDKSYKLSFQFGAMHFMVANWSDPSWSFAPVSGFHEIVHTSNARIAESRRTVALPSGFGAVTLHHLFHFGLGVVRDAGGKATR